MKKEWSMFLRIVLIFSTLLFIKYKDKKMLQQIIDYSKQSEKQMEIAGKRILVKEDNVLYRYKIIMGELCFDELNTEIPDKKRNDIAYLSISAKEPNIAYSLITKERNMYDVLVKYYTRKKDGSRELYPWRIGFLCGEDFSRESLSKTDGKAILGKSNNYYTQVTRDFISQEELQKLLAKANEIRDEISGR